MSYKRRYISSPYAYVQQPIWCSFCKTDLEAVETWLECPDCGHRFPDVETGYSVAEPDWEKETVIPDLWLNSQVKLPRDAKIRVKLLKSDDNDSLNEKFPFYLTVNGTGCHLCSTREEAEAEMRELKQAIAEHYALQDRKKQENAQS